MQPKVAGCMSERRAAAPSAGTQSELIPGETPGIAVYMYCCYGYSLCILFV
jgi:hypothetical protein